MTITDTIYQHVKALPPAKALEVLHFAEFQALCDEWDQP